MADLTITKVTVPVSAQANQSFAIAVDATSTADDFQDGVAYNLTVFVCKCQGGDPVPNTPVVIKGHLQDTDGDKWTALSHTFNLTVKAAASCPDIYTVTAVLSEGGPQQPLETPPSIVSSSPIFVVC